MPIYKLTQAKIARLMREHRDGVYNDGGNLYLQIDGCSASWLFRFMRFGRRRYMGLGALHVVGLSDARERALAARKVLHAGGDPIMAREAEHARKQLEAAKSMTFDACVAAYLEAHRAGWKNPKHRQQWENTLKTYVSPVFGTLPVGDIDTGLVMKAIDPIWTKKPETAARVRGRIESPSSATVAAIGGAKIRRVCAAHPDQLLPAHGKVRKVKHHTALSYADLPAFMIDLRLQRIAARALEL